MTEEEALERLSGLFQRIEGSLKKIQSAKKTEPVQIALKCTERVMALLAARRSAAQAKDTRGNRAA